VFGQKRRRGRCRQPNGNPSSVTTTSAVIKLRHGRKSTRISKAKPQSVPQQASVFFRKLKVRSRIVVLQAEVTAHSGTAAALTLDAHVKKLRELRDKADQRGQTSAAIRAEELRGQLKRFHVKQVESGDAHEFSRSRMKSFARSSLNRRSP
jgi:hypothetical protein